MSSTQSLLGLFIPFILFQQSWAQSGPGVFSLPGIPTSACDGKAGEGSATFSTMWPKETGTQLNVYSDGNSGYASQGGAQWQIWTDTTGAEFSFIGVPGAGAGFGGSEDPATDLQKLLKINSDGHSTTFNISSDASLFDRQILISVVPPGASNLSVTRRGRLMRPRAVKLSTGTAPVSSSTAIPGPYNVTASGVWQCASQPGAPTSVQISTAVASVASACAANQVTGSPDAWQQYGVQAYLSSIISTETNKPSHSNIPVGGLPGGPIKSEDLDIGALIVSDVAANGHPTPCVISSQCGSIQCNDVQGNAVVDSRDPARMMVWNSYANLNNILYTYWEAIKFANIEELNNQDQFINIFYTGTPPSVLWKDLTGEAAPFLSMLGTLSGLIPGIKAISVFGFISGGILNEAAADYTTATQNPVFEEKFEKAADLGSAIQNYVTNMTSVVENLHTALIDDVFGPNLLNMTANGELLADFGLSESNYSSAIINDVSALFYMKAIDWTLKQNNVFMMWVPFGAKFSLYNGGNTGDPENRKVSKEYDNFSQANCEADFQGGDNGTVFTVCDAGDLTPGMARIYQITDKIKTDTYTSAVQGWDSAFAIPGGWTFNLPDVMRGAVNSWQHGGFNYDLTTANSSVMQDMIQNFDGSPTRPGTWTIPVCSSASRYDTNPPTGYETDGNYLNAFPDSTKGTNGWGPRGFFDCWMGMQYQNSSTGARPDWFGPEFASQAGLPSDLKAAVSP